MELARSSAAHKSWATRRANAAKNSRVERTNESRREEVQRLAGEKAWATRRANAAKRNPTAIMAALRPGRVAPAPVANDSLTKGLRKRSITAKTVVEKISASTRLEYYAGTDRNVLVMYNK